MRAREIDPKCNREKCQNNEDGYCIILTDTKGCRFYKEARNERKEDSAGGGEAE